MKFQILVVLILLALLVFRNRNSKFTVSTDCEYCTNPDANKEFCKVYCPGASPVATAPDAAPFNSSPVGPGIVNGECVNLANPTVKVDMAACTTNNGQVYFDILGSVNQRNYPMIGKDQGGLDLSSTLPPDVNDMNVLPVNKNMIGYQISGGELSSTSILPDEDTTLLDLAIPGWVVPQPGRV